jgi:hypothetical protein
MFIVVLLQSLKIIVQDILLSFLKLFLQNMISIVILIVHFLKSLLLIFNLFFQCSILLLDILIVDPLLLEISF